MISIHVSLPLVQYLFAVSYFPSPLPSLNQLCHVFVCVWANEKESANKETVSVDFAVSLNLSRFALFPIPFFAQKKRTTKEITLKTVDSLSFPSHPYWFNICIDLFKWLPKADRLHKQLAAGPLLPSAHCIRKILADRLKMLLCKQTNGCRRPVISPLRWRPF